MIQLIYCKARASDHLIRLLYIVFVFKFIKSSLTPPLFNEMPEVSGHEHVLT